ncbi:MAG: hypothetical protein ABIK53_02875 [bacterium]
MLVRNAESAGVKLLGGKMKTIKIILIMGAVLLLTNLLMAEEKVKNLSINASFEQGEEGKVTGWIFWNWAPEGIKRTSIGTWDHTISHSGKCSLKVEGFSKEQSGYWRNTYGPFYFPVSIEGGKTYGISFYLKTQIPEPGEDNTVVFNVSSLDVNHNGLSEGGLSHKEKITKSSDWKRMQTIVTTPKEATGLGIHIGFAGKGAAWFDDVEVVLLTGAQTFEPIWIEAEEYASGHDWTKIIQDKDASGGAYVEAKYILLQNLPVPQLTEKGVLLPFYIFAKVLSKEEDGKAWLGVYSVTQGKGVKRVPFSSAEWKWVRLGPFSASQLGSIIHLYGGYAAKKEEGEDVVWRKAALDAIVFTTKSLTDKELKNLEEENKEGII